MTLTPPTNPRGPAPPESRHKVVLQISDVHLLAAGLLNRAVDTYDNLLRVIAQIDDGGKVPDAVIFSGDLADKGEPGAYQRLRAAVEPWVSRMGVPAVYLPGNHDARPAFRTHLLGWEANEEPIDQVIWSDGLRIVALDSTVPGRTHGELRPDQLTWLAAELAVPAPLGTLLVLHHPPIPGPSSLLSWIALRDPGPLAEVVAGTDVVMVLAGHSHHPSAGVLGGVPVWVSSATAYQMDVPVIGANRVIRGVQGSAFTWVDVFEGSAVATHVPLIPADRVLYESPVESLRRAISLEASGA
ncbi:MAG: metallophosphoesterase [Acidimicrobiaceae bacterium]|nr:metallophosphoesterase [Acidimicrobiaceae bacterium]